MAPDSEVSRTTTGTTTRTTKRTIDCDECVMDGTAACHDCVVTFIMGRRPGEAVVVDAAEERAVGLLAGAGLVPALRHTLRAR